MIYYCENCYFIFKRSGEVETCPDCGSPRVRFANEDEQSEYKERKEHPETSEV